MSQNEIQFFANAKTPAHICSIFAADTRHPGVIHARVYYLLQQGLTDEAFKLVDSREDAVRASTWQLLATHPATRHLYS